MIEMSLEEFKGLSEVERERGIVDWMSVLKEFSGKVVTYGDVKEYIREKYGKFLWYSEWSNVCERYGLKKNVVILSKKRLINNRIRRLWYIEVIEGGGSEEGSINE